MRLPGQNRPRQQQPVAPPEPPADSTRVMPTRQPSGQPSAGNRAAPSGYPGQSSRVHTARPGGRPLQGTGARSPQGPGGPSSPGGPSAPGRDGTARPAGAPVKRKRIWLRVLIALVLVVALWAGLLVWAGLSAWGKVSKVDAFPSGDRPSSGKGTNVLMVGSDSRAGLSAKEGRSLGTGGSSVASGTSRTDSIMILHIPDSGKPTLVSLQRDSWVTIPGRTGRHKINSAFSIGGAKLLTQTVEQATGLRIDNYMEIGFGGFAGVVNAVGGVRMCLTQNVKDEDAHIDLKKGCQTLNGKNALGYVRSRHAFATGDLARAQHQREFLAALMKKIASPTNLLLPWKLKSIGDSAADGVAVDNSMSPIRALKILWTLKGISSDGTSVQVPVADANYYIGGESGVLWNSTQAKELFDDLRNDRSVSVAQ